MEQELEIIHASLVNGNYKQMVSQIDDHFPFFSDFCRKYLAWLKELYGSHAQFRTLEYFSEAVISYHVTKEDY
jgi:hypothetical protein